MTSGTPVDQTLGLVGTFLEHGLGYVILYFFARYHVKKQEQWDKKQLEWNAERDRERAEWRKNETELTNRLLSQSEGIVEKSLKLQESNQTIVSKANEMVAQAAKREEEVREELARERQKSNPNWNKR